MSVTLILRFLSIAQGPLAYKPQRPCSYIIPGSMEMTYPGRRNPLLDPKASRTGTPSMRAPMLSASPRNGFTPVTGRENPPRHRYWSVAETTPSPGAGRNVRTPVVSCGLNSHEPVKYVEVCQ